mgnify:CR=1 FL=1
MRKNLSSAITLPITDVFDNEFGHGILAAKEVSTGNALHTLPVVKKA